MSITLTRVAAPGEEWADDRTYPNIVPTLPAVLGRGSLLMCGDKKVSRRHAYLDWDDDNVQITAGHQCPTYIVAKGVEKVLSIGESLLLSHGDMFGLLKENFWYKINISSSKEEGKESVGRQKSEKENHNGIPEDLAKEGEAEDKEANHLNDATPDSSSNDISAKERKETKVKVSAVAPQTISTQELQEAVSSRKRNLPSWMKNIDASKSSTSEAKKDQTHTHGGARKTQTAVRKQRPVKNLQSNDDDASVSVKKKTNTPKNSNLDKTRAAISDESVDESSNRPKVANLNKTPTKNKKASPSPKKRATPTKKGSPLKNKTQGLHTMSDESESDSGSEAEQILAQTAKKGVEAARNVKTPPKRQSPAKRQSPKKHDISDEEESADEVDESSSSKPKAANAAGGTPSPAVPKRPRQPCQYGANCYRKNPNHLSNFAHVGDSDYYEISSDPDDSGDDRPQCEFGVNCYRKNPQHRKTHRHSRIPQPQRRAKRKARQQKKGDESDSDDYDYDDPFLNDGSSDDYAPTDSGSDSPMEADGEDENDVRRMLKEGKKFVKKR